MNIKKIIIILTIISLFVIPSIGAGISSMQKSVKFNTENQVLQKEQSEIKDGDINKNEKTGLVGYWNFDEGSGDIAHDTSGFNNDGGIYGAKWNGEGISSYSLKFDGNWDTILVDDDDSLNFDDTNAFSLSVWVKWDGEISPANQGIIQNMFLQKGYKLVLQNNGEIRFGIGQGTKYNWLDKEINANKWYHISAVWDGYIQSLYFNGELVNQSIIENFKISSENIKYLEFGNNWGYTDNLNTFNGLIDEIRIYEQDLSEDEIKELFHQGQQSGLIGYWNFDDSNDICHDYSGNENHGINYGATWTTDSIVGEGAVIFDGIDDYMEIPDATDFKFTDQSITFTCWTQIVDNPNEYRRFIALKSINSNGYPSVSLVKCRSGFNDGRIVFSIHDNDNEITMASSIYNGNQLPKNTWLFVTGVIEYPDSIKLYINGELQESVPAISYDMTDHEDISLNFGKSATSPDMHKGMLDEIRIYERALTENEIIDLYNQGQQPDNLKGYWNFDDSNDICHDYSGNENHGINYGATWTTDSIVGEGAVIFDGIDDYMEIPDATDFKFTDQSITFTCWTQIVDNPNEYRRFIALKSINSNGYPSVSLVKCRSGFNDGRIVFSIHDNDNEITMASSIYNGNQLPKNTWLFVTGVIEYPDSIKLYINGELQESVPAISYDMTDHEDISLNFGKSATSPDMHKGMLDEIRIYERALTENEIIDLYNQGAKPPKADFTFIPHNPSIHETVMFTDLSTDDGEIKSWWWDFGDGYYSDLQHPWHDYYNAGEYTINLTVSDNDGETSSIAKKIEVNNVNMN